MGRKFVNKSLQSDKRIQQLVVRPKVARQMLGNCSSAKLYELINTGVLESFNDTGGARWTVVASIHGYIAQQVAAQKNKKRDVSKAVRARRANRGTARTRPSTSETDKPPRPSIAPNSRAKGG
jgi:hypothetical protein